MCVIMFIFLIQCINLYCFFFFFSSRRRHTRWPRDWSSDVCSSDLIANELAVRQHIKIVVTGGVTRGQSYELIGPLASLVLAELTLDWAILGVDALDPRTGATAHHEGEASINHLMATRAEQVMIVTDSSKLGQRAFARVCATDEIDVIVTERGARVITA